MYLGIFALNNTIYFRATTISRQGSALDATSGPIFSVFAVNSSTVLTSGTMTKVGSNEGFYEGYFTASSSTFSTGQYFILVSATVDSQTPSVNVTFQLVGANNDLATTFAEIEDISDNLVISSGSISVDHNYGSTDRFRVMSNGTPIADVQIRAFVKSDYDAGRKANSYIVGQARTRTDGRWASVIRLDAGTYTLEFSKTGSFKTTTANVTVS